MNISTPGGRIWLPLLLLLCSASTTFGFQNFTDYVITNTDSSGAGSLHEALTAIDGQAGAYRITFDPSLKAQTIPYNVLMNNLVDTLVINGDIDGDKIPDVTLDGGQDRAGIHNHSLNAYLELRSVRISNVHQWAVFPYTFRFNTAASILVEDCILENNEGSWFRLFSNGGSVTLTVNNTQFGNASNLEPSLYEGFGEGVQATFTNVTVQGNNRPDYYPGVMFYQREGFLHLRNSLIYDNQESFIIYAEGLNGEDAEVTLTHVTIANNEITEPSSPYSGPSGVIGVGLARVIINNSLIAANPTVSSTFANFYDNQEGGSITLNNSIAINSAPGYFTDFNNDDYTLADNSPAIDTGSFALIDGLTTDLLGNTRPSNGLLPDVGAFEKQVLAAPAVYTVTNTLASGAGSLNNILDQIHQQTGSHFITFDPGLIGQTIPWNRDLFLNGNLFIEGDLNGDGESDITLTSNGQPAGITTATSGLLLELYNLVFDSFRGSQNGPQVITFNHQGEVRIDGCDFLNSPDTWLLLNHPTDVITLTANDLRFEGNSDDYAMAYLGNGENITATFTNCIAQNNVSSVGSSRLFYAITSDIIVKNSLITDNLVGRGISSTSANVTIVPSSKIIHTTIANNTIPGSSGLGMVVSLSGIVSLENSLVVGNKDQGGTVRNTFVGAAYGTLLTTGSVVADDITGYFKDAGNQDYRLASESPAKNVGLETLIGDLTEDLAGNDRPTVSTAPDAGAYESLEATFWVTNIQNSGPGSLTDVINQVRGQPGDFLIRFDPVLKGSDVPFLTELWVGEGKVTVDGDVDGDQVADISLKNGASSGYFDLFTAGSELELRHLVVKGLRPFQSSAIQAQVSGKVTIVGCEFRNISRTIITGTTATQDSLIFDISNTRFISNTRDDFSGVLFTISPQTKAYFKNCIIQGNSPNGVRRLIYLSGSSAEFENCLITDNNTNWAIDYYGTVNTDTSELIIRHTTITNNTPSIRDDIHAVSVRDGKVGIFNSLIVGNTSADGVSRDLSIAGNALTNGTIANQVNDGFFTDEAGGDYTLATNSPAVDAGDPTFIGGLTTDPAGNIRPQGLPDAGAFEKLIDPMLAVSLSLDTCGGATVTDATSGESIGNLLGGTTRKEGYQGQGLQFDGMDDQVALFDSTYALTVGDGLSYSLWVYPTRNNKRWETLIERKAAPVSSILALEFGEPAFYLGGLNNAFWIKADTLLPLHTWSQLVATYANGTARIYLNGALVKEQSGLAGQLNFNPGFHILGQRGDNTRGFAGKLDEVRIFNYALTPQEANGEATRLTFSPTVCLPTAAAQYSFSECSGSTTFDGSGSNDGTLVGASFGTGYDGTGMTFDGNDYVNLGSDASLDFSTGFTFAAWVNTTQANGRRVIAIDNYNGSNWSYAISLLDGQPELGLGTGVTVPFPLRLNTNIADGSWHHLAFTYGQGTVTGYIDGAEVVQWRNLPGAIIPNSGTDVWLGGRSGKNRFFTGSLDEVQLYGQALTAFEISELAGLVQNSTNCPGARPALEAEELVLATSWEVYPNPSEGAITLRAESPFTSETTILITNTLGQVVYSQKLEAGTFEMQIGGLRNAKAGLYLITLVNAEMRQAKTLQIR